MSLAAKKLKKVTSVDLFCGAGGTSSGLAEACRELGAEVELIAINHWTIAVETHKRNHPWATHYCESIERLNPRKVVPSGRLKILVASPECTNHSNASGGRPKNEQSRATAWHILKWAQELYIENILVENVPEFLDWGPLGADSKPMKSRKGETFKSFVEALRSFDYRVEHRILNAADYGDATTRKRLFLIARRPAHKKIVWPEPSHVKDVSSQELFGERKAWRAAREIIDWSVNGESIFNRKKPLKRTTLERIAAGLKKFCGDQAEPFLVVLRQHMDGQSLNSPLPTVCAGGEHLALCEPKPFVLQQQSGGAPRSVEQPLPAIATKGAQSLITPFLVPFYSEREGQKPRVHDVNEPVPTIPASGDGKFAVVEPFIITPVGTDLPGGRSASDPLPTVMTRDRFAVVEPFVIGMEHGKKNGNEKLQPYMVPTNHGDEKRTYSVEKPMPTITTVDAWGVVEPYLVKFYKDKKSQNQSVKEPLHTVPTKDRFGLAEPQVTRVGLDIRFRMLKPHELAAAMGFPKDYEFSGNRSEQVKQIGNAVPCFTAKALCKALLEE